MSNRVSGTERSQLCHGLRSRVLDEAFLPLPYGLPKAHGLRDGCVDAGEVVVGNDIDPSAPPNDKEVAPAEANGLADGDGSAPERSPLGAVANGFDSTSVNPIALEFVDSG